VSDERWEWDGFGVGCVWNMWRRGGGADVHTYCTSPRNQEHHRHPPLAATHSCTIATSSRSPPFSPPSQHLPRICPANCLLLRQWRPLKTTTRSPRRPRRRRPAPQATRPSPPSRSPPRAPRSTKPRRRLTRQTGPPHPPPRTSSFPPAAALEQAQTQTTASSPRFRNRRLRRGMGGRRASHVVGLMIFYGRILK
jgi:hypothetical protein